VLDPKNFVLAVHDPENSLREATDSALRHVFGSSEMDQVLTEGREQIAADVQTRLQYYLDLYNTGVQVEKVNVEGTTPPEQVKAAFDDVIRAREDEERAKNEAQTYANGIIPEARGQAQRIIEEATAYRDQVVARAEGEAARFEKLLTEYQKAPAVTRERLYLDTMQDVMAGSSKVLVDVEGGNNMLYLPLDRMVSGGGAVQAPASTSAGGSAASAPNVRELTDRVVEQLRADAQNAARRREGR
jgi:membrane protease subunit HflK